MDSLEEAQLFKQYGWTYDYIRRLWYSPVDENTVVTTDELVIYNDSPANEQRLVEAIQRYGSRPSNHLP